MSHKFMNLMGFLLLVAGWILALAAVVILPPGPARGAFTLAGVSVEVLGLTLVIRAHIIPHGDKR